MLLGGVDDQRVDGMITVEIDFILECCKRASCRRARDRGRRANGLPEGFLEVQCPVRNTNQLPTLLYCPF
jgi:hypothetical protein